MDIRILKNAEEIGAAAGKIICDFVNEKPDCVLGFATGASPVPTYNYLIEQYNEGRVSFKDVTTFNLDEYCGLPEGHKNSYRTFMFENLFSKVDINPGNVNFLDGNADEAEENDCRHPVVAPWLRRKQHGGVPAFVPCRFRI